MVVCFLVGNQGRFDGMVLGCLRRIAAKYPEITYRVVLAYMPKTGDDGFCPGETMLPEGMESIDPKYAIAHRNRWMAEESDAAVVYERQQQSFRPVGEGMPSPYKEDEGNRWKKLKNQLTIHLFMLKYSGKKATRYEKEAA